MENRFDFLFHCFKGLEEKMIKWITADGYEVAGDEAIIAALQHVDNEGSSLLNFAIESENTKLCRYVIRLIQKYSKIAPELKNIINHHKEDGETAMHMAAELGKKEIITDLLRAGARNDPYNKNRETPIILAAKRNRHVVVGYLAEKFPASVYKADGDGWTALLIAASEGHIEAADALLKRNADPENKEKNDRTMVFLAAQEGHWKFLEDMFRKHPVVKVGFLGHIRTVTYFIRRPRNPDQDLINYRDQYENTPCHAAAEEGYSNVMRVLIKYGAIVGLKNDEEQTAMHKAAKFGQSNIIRQLHKRDDTLIGDWDENNDLPLHIAAVNGHKQCVKLLIELGSQVDERNTKGWTPLDCAAANGAYDVCRELIDHDAPIDAMDRSGTTPLQLACRGGFEDVVKLLLDKGADCSIIDNTFSAATSETDVTSKWQGGGLNCLDYAIDYYQEEVVEVLLKSDQWEQCLENAYLDPNSGQILTPMRKLIKHLPNQAKIAFDRCVKVKSNKNEYSLEDAPRKAFENKELEIKFNFNYLDDDYLVAEWGNASPDDASDLLSVSNEKQTEVDISLIPDETVIKEPYDLKKKILIGNHPLNYLISNNRQELISHPLVTSLYNIKWNRTGI